MRRPPKANSRTAQDYLLYGDSSSPGLKSSDDAMGLTHGALTVAAINAVKDPRSRCHGLDPWSAHDSVRKQETQSNHDVSLHGTSPWHPMFEAEALLSG